MRNGKRRVVQLGELVAAVYDSAARHSADPRVISGLAVRALAHLLWRRPRRSSIRASSP